jgi:SAM-dependent methyltransferase
LDKAVSELYRILKPGGTLLVANPYINVCDTPPYENPAWVPFNKRNGTVIWRLTPEGLSAVLGKVFGGENVTIRTYGNSLTAAGELRGLAVHEFTKSELDFHDPRFAVIVCARAIKRASIAADACAEEQEINGR